MDFKSTASAVGLPGLKIVEMVVFTEAEHYLGNHGLLISIKKTSKASRYNPVLEWLSTDDLFLNRSHLI